MLPSANLTDAAKLKGKIASARRQQTTYYGKKPFVNLKGLKIKQPNSIVEEIVTEPTAVQKWLTDYWRPIYSAKTPGSSQLQKLLGIFSRQVGPSLTFASIALPEVEDYESNIAAQKHSSPGPDGVPFAAYKPIASTTAAALKNLADVFASPPPPLPSPPPSPPELARFSCQKYVVEFLSDFNKQDVIFALRF